MHDLRYAIRGLRRAPGFAFAAILTLALGIGAVTSVFSVADAVLLRPLPYPESNRLVMVWDELINLGVERLGLYGQIFHEYAAQEKIFDATAAFEPGDRNLVGDRDSERVSTTAATSSLFPMLGATPQFGRGFQKDEHGDVAILSHALFARRYGSDPAILGKPIRLDGRAYTVIGILRPGFDFGDDPEPVDIWTPLVVSNGAGLGSLRMLARLRPGVSLEAARAAMNAEARHLDETIKPHYGPNGENPGFGVKVIPLHDELLGSVRPATLLLICAVGAVLLIACVNVANLLLVRAVSREREIAVRRALGAPQARLIRQWLTEAALIVGVGGSLGAVAAQWGVRVLIALSPATLPSTVPIQVDARALVFALAVSCSVCVAFAIAPLVADRRVQMQLRGARPKSRAGFTLIAAETALALMLLIGSGLLLKSFARLIHVNAGFNPERLLTMRADLAPERYPDAYRRVEFFDTAIARIKSLPGVIVAGAVSRLPISTNPNVSARGGNPFSIEGQSWHPASPIDGSVPQTAHNQVADPGYFRALQIPLLDGRFFTKSDVQNAPPVVIVNEKLARAFFPRGAIGRRILLGAPQPGAPWLTIVGVVGDVRMTALAHDIMPQFYTPQAQDANASMTIVVRTNSDPLRIAREAAAVVRSIDAEVPVYDVNTMEQRIARSVSQPRFETTILAFFAAAALFLAAIGIFGVVAHSAARRTQEIGIRMALGADRARVLRHVVADGLRPVALGAVAGVISAAALGHVLSSVLFHVTPQDPQIFILAVTTLGIVAIAASFLPARRATRIDPMNALRSE